MTRARFDACASGQFRIGHITINRRGYGAMRITGTGIWPIAPPTISASSPGFRSRAGELTESGGIVDRIAKAHGATAGQVALAWLLQRSDDRRDQQRPRGINEQHLYLADSQS